MTRKFPTAIAFAAAPPLAVLAQLAFMRTDPTLGTKVAP